MKSACLPMSSVPNSLLAPSTKAGSREYALKASRSVNASPSWRETAAAMPSQGFGVSTGASLFKTKWMTK